MSKRSEVVVWPILLCLEKCRGQTGGVSTVQVCVMPGLHHTYINNWYQAYSQSSDLTQTPFNVTTILDHCCSNIGTILIKLLKHSLIWVVEKVVDDEETLFIIMASTTLW